jgi:hypothetical protein
MKSFGIYVVLIVFGNNWNQRFLGFRQDPAVTSCAGIFLRARSGGSLDIQRTGQPWSRR